MSDKSKDTDNIVRFLKEREKELNCLYQIESALQNQDASIDDVCNALIVAIPPGWQYPDVCIAKIFLNGKEYMSPDFQTTPWYQTEEIRLKDNILGEISVYYTDEMPRADNGPFLKEESKLLRTIADRLGNFIMFKTMNKVFHEYQNTQRDIDDQKIEQWRAVLNLISNTDKTLYYNISRKMLNFLCWSGVEDAEDLRSQIGSGESVLSVIELENENRPTHLGGLYLNEKTCKKIFYIASANLTGDRIMDNIQKWIREDRLGFLIQIGNRNLSLADIADALRKYKHMDADLAEIPAITKRGIEVSLIRRFLASQPSYVNVAKDYIGIDDFYNVIDRIIFTENSQGKLGGKSAGLFLAEKVLKKVPDVPGSDGQIKIPKTWYITSDVFLEFLAYNDLNEVFEQKYKDLNQIRFEYPHIVQSFKSAQFPPEIIKGLSLVLDEFKDRPIIVRSSSLLEDRMGAAFSGKYKSLFIANIGTKEERLKKLTDAISEVYASVFGPDPIEYRAERGLLDFAEEMGIMIQEVVGIRLEDYYFPIYAGVAFSRNEFRWSPRIKRKDGLVRLVLGLGTRAVDRTSNDYPVLLAPGQPGLKVNISADEIARYAPRMIDIVNMKNGEFETVEIDDLLKKYGDRIPGINKLISKYDGQDLRSVGGIGADFASDRIVVTFDGLIGDRSFVKRLYELLRILEEKIETPIDIEFASDGKDFYLLQCRPQSSLEESTPSPIPKNIPHENIIFTARKFISNGKVPDITHVVYVDPDSYGKLPDRGALLSVGKAIGALNKLLPKRKFILMGPGRWGSRGDIKLGVNVTYSDINNTSLLIEIAKRKGNYTPELSFGTHFFQDLVEASIKYLPLYPDEEEIVFNENYLTSSTNVLKEILPEFGNLSETVKVIDIPQISGGRILKILFNADLDEAVGYLAKSSNEREEAFKPVTTGEKQNANYWIWRMRAAEKIASLLDPERYGVKGIYIIGSTKNASAGPGSDIDLLIHFAGDEQQKKDLMIWLEGWSQSLAEYNFMQTGYKAESLLDIHIITDQDIANKSSYAVKIGAPTDPARRLRMKGQ